MNNTEKIIAQLKSRVTAIDKQIDSHRANGAYPMIGELQALAGQIEAQIKRHEHLNNLSGNEVHETISMLATMIDTMDQYSHVASNVMGVRVLLDHRFNEFQGELDRRQND